MPAEPTAPLPEIAWFDRSDRVRLEIAGPDRAKFLHNLVTQDVKRMPEGAGREAFVTNPQGKTLAYVTLLAGPDSILLRTDPASLEGLLPHLRKYGVFDDVTIDDASSRTFEYHLIGASIPGFEVSPGDDLGHRTVDVGGFAVRAIREALVGRAGLTLVGPIEAAEAVRGRLEAAGFPKLDAATFERLRIEAGTPVSGLDVTLGNLPQEVGRDARAINFVKGCYLGQETVARLDALGHVNRIFKGATVEGGEVPPAGTALSFEGKAAGSVTSSAISARSGQPVLLAYVKVAQAEPGTRLELSTGGVAVVFDLPVTPRPSLEGRAAGSA